VGPPFQTIVLRRVKYLVERFQCSASEALDIRFILHGPTRDYWIVPSTERPDRLIAISRISYFGAFRHSPFAGIWFTVTDDGKLIRAGHDA
jgi:hypothetical protein